MAIFTWLIMSRIERVPLGFLERCDSGILGVMMLSLGVGIIFWLLKRFKRGHTPQVLQNASSARQS